MRFTKCRHIEGLGFDIRSRGYERYLAENRPRFPPNAWAFASAKWHYDWEDERCPNNAWLESLTISERWRGRGDASVRGTSIEVRLIGMSAIRISYSGVEEFVIQKLGVSKAIANQDHGSWLVDELRLGRKSVVVHEVQFVMAK